MAAFEVATEDISCFYTERALNQYAIDNSAVHAMLNKHAGFWNVHRYCLQSTFFMVLGRVFENGGNVRSIYALLGAAIQHPELFSKGALRARKVALIHDTPDWLDDRINEAWEPTSSDLRQLKKALAPHASKFRSVYAPIRHQVFGHSIVTEQHQLRELFAKAQIPEIEDLLRFLRDLLSSLNNLFLNGTKLNLGNSAPSHRERTMKEVRRLLEEFGLRMDGSPGKSNLD